MVKKLLLGFVGLIVVVVVIGIAAGGGSKQTTPSGSAAGAAAESSSPAGNANDAPSGPLAIGQSAQVEDVTVTLTKVRVANDVFTKEGTQTALAEFHITNTGDDLYNLSTLLQFEAYTADN